MEITVFAHAFWRQVKNGNRTFEAVLEPYKEQVKYLAKTDVSNGLITSAEYKDLIGEEYETTESEEPTIGE